MKGYLALLATALIFGIFSILIQVIDQMAGPVFQVALRNAGALLCLAPFAIWYRKRFHFSRTTTLLLLLYSLIAAISFTFVTLALLAAPIKTVIVARYATTIVISFVVSLLLLREGLNRINVYATLLALIGLLLFMYPTFSLPILGTLYAALAAFTFLITTYIIKQTPKICPEQLMLFEFTTIAGTVGLFVVLTSQPTMTSWQLPALLATIAFSALLVLVTYLIVYGFRTTNFNLANIVLTSEIFFGIGLGYVILKQNVTLTELLAISLIFIAAILPNIVSYLKDNKPTVRSDSTDYELRSTN